MRAILIPAAALLVTGSAARAQDGPFFLYPAGTPREKVAALTVDAAFKGITLDADHQSQGLTIVLHAMTVLDELDPKAKDVLMQTQVVVLTRNAQLKALLATDTDRSTFDANVRRPRIGERRAAGPARDNAYIELDVDKPAHLIVSPPKPIYPPELRSLGLDGEVLASFVVDSTGRVDASTFRVVRSSDRLFTEAARAVLSGYRFEPAELHGVKVRQVVSQLFQFTLRPHD
jgi:TonB family protein